MIEGTIARSEALFSGRLQYRVKSGFPDGKAKQVRECAVTFSGSSWRLDWSVPITELSVELSKSAKNVQIEPGQLKGRLETTHLSRHGKSVEYRATPQLSDEMRHTARIAGEQPINRALGSPPIFAGSFWFECMKSFVQANRQKANRKPSTTLNGVVVEVLEWQVVPEDSFKAFHSTNGLTNQGGMLRVYAAPQLGCVLPRIECVGKDGVVATLFEGSGFKEFAKGIVLPTRLSMQYYDTDGPGFRIDYEITEATSLNDQIPDRAFVAELPIGTHVYDARSGTSSTYFQITKDGPMPQELADVIAVRSPNLFSRTWVTALILGAMAGIAMLLFAWLFRRYRKMRAGR
ncbi:MAG: hypothetical protein U0797_16095 [Gemmataceae bacterium]